MTDVKTISSGKLLLNDQEKSVAKTEKKTPEQVKDGKKKIALALTGLGIAAAAGVGIAVAVKKGKINLPSLKNNVQTSVKDKAGTLKETIDKYEALLNKEGISEKTKQQIEHRLEVLKNTQVDMADMGKLKSMGKTKAEYLANRQKEKISKFLSNVVPFEAGITTEVPYGLTAERCHDISSRFVEKLDDKVMFMNKEDMCNIYMKNMDNIAAFFADILV